MNSDLGDIPSGYRFEVNGHKFEYSVIDRAAGVIDLSVDGRELHRTDIKEAPPDFQAWCAEYIPTERGPLNRGSGGGELYSILGGRLTYTSKRKVRKNGVEEWEDIETPLSNFAAWITGESIRDDGLERTLHLSVAGKLSNGQQLATLDVPAKDFASMAWVSKWGARAVIHVGAYLKDHTRAAIQYLSPPYRTRTIYTHVGWRKIDGELLFLHTGGAIGADGSRTDIDVVPGDTRLSRYELPEPPEGNQRLEAVRAVLDLLEDVSAADVPETVIYPEIALTFRAPLNECYASQCNDFVTGLTGVLKTSTSAVFQSFFGANFDAETLPGSWTSTENALERIAHAAKDVAFTIDDFIPKGSSLQVQRTHDKADRVMRGHANKSGRQRMRPDGSLAPQYFSRASIKTTGEEVPSGHSLRGRLLIREIKQGDIDLEWLTDAQEKARIGVYASAMAAYIHWLAPQIERFKVEDTIREAQNAKRDAFASEFEEHKEHIHPRTASNIAEYYIGFEMFVKFACDVGAIDEAEANEYLATCASVLKDIAYNQAGYIRTEEPTRQFIQLLRAGIVGGYSHLCDASHNNVPLPPNDPSMLGWTEGPARTDKDGCAIDTWRPRGICIGWIDDDAVYLDGNLAYAAAQKVARDQGSSLPLSRATIWGRLADKNRLVVGADGRFSVLKKIAGRPKRVRQMHAIILTEDG